MTQPLQDQPGQPYTAGSPGAPPAPYEGWAPHPTQGAYAASYPDVPPPPYMAQMRPPPHPQAGTLGIVAVALAGIVTVVELGEAVVAAPTEELLRDAVAGGASPWDVITPIDFFALPFLLAQLAAGVVTAIWLTQARDNAEALHPTAPHARSKVWAWLGWFVPFVSLWFPRQVVRDVRSATVADERKYATVVGWWWAMWLLYGFSGQIGAFIPMGMRPGQLGGAGLTEWEIINAVVAVVALVLWARIVLEVRRDQQAVALGRPTVRVVR